MKAIKIYIILIIFLLFLTGCGISTQSVNSTLNTASLQIGEAQKAGAEQFAFSEFDESRTLYQSAQSAQDNRQKVMLAERANAKARLAKALADQTKSEKEAEKLERELKVIEEKAFSIRVERQTTEEELNQFLQK